MTGKQKSAVFIGVQLLVLGLLALTGPLLSAHPLWIWLEIAGFYLGAWAVWTMKLRNLRIAPDVAATTRLVTKGPYRFVRHPMYAAVLLVTLALVLSRPTLLRCVAWLILLADLLAKLRYEETLLERRFSEYVAYRKRTKRLIPFVY